MASSIAGVAMGGARINAEPVLAKVKNESPKPGVLQADQLPSLLKGFFGAASVVGFTGAVAHYTLTGFQSPIKNPYCERTNSNILLSAVATGVMAAGAAGVVGMTVDLERAIFEGKDHKIAKAIAGIGFSAVMLIPISLGGVQAGFFGKVFLDELAAYSKNCFPKSDDNMMEQTVAEDETSSQRVVSHASTNPLQAMGYQPIALPEISSAQVSAISRAQARAQEAQETSIDSISKLALARMVWSALSTATANAAAVIMPIVVDPSKLNRKDGGA